MPIPLEALIFAFLLVLAYAISRTWNLFAAAIVSGIFSLCCAGVYTLVDAVDVAFTEAAVGAGMSLVLFLATLHLVGDEEARKKESHALPAVVALTCGVALLAATSDMPAYGDVNAPIHHDLVDRYIVGSQTDINMPNFVTAVLASYRGFDTFGELGVIFTAAVAVMLILGVPPHRGERPSQSPDAMTKPTPSSPSPKPEEHDS